jgi:hypothetical protein
LTAWQKETRVVGILFNVLFVYPMRRFLAHRNAIWQARKDAGERVFPLKPDTVFLLGLVGVLPAIVLADAIVGSIF